MPTPQILCRICQTQLKKKNHWLNINLHHDCLEAAVLVAIAAQPHPPEKKDE